MCKAHKYCKGENIVETIEKLLAIPLPVWIGLFVGIPLFVWFLWATSLSNVKGDYKVSKPEGPLANGSPHGNGRDLHFDGEEFPGRVEENPADRKYH